LEQYESGLLYCLVRVSDYPSTFVSFPRGVRMLCPVRQSMRVIAIFDNYFEMRVRPVVFAFAYKKRPNHESGPKHALLRTVPRRAREGPNVGVSDTNP
jgi:hypothetical protein